MSTGISIFDWTEWSRAEAGEAGCLAARINLRLLNILSLLTYYSAKCFVMPGSGSAASCFLTQIQFQNFCFSPFLVFQYKLPDVYRSMIAYAFLKLIESWLHALFFVNAPIYGASSIFEGFFKGSRGLTKRSALLCRTSRSRLG